MSDNNLGDLVKKAKGEDRSIREYARDSDVNYAVISKIISGTYIPKKTSVYEMLTSSKAAPRGGVTYNQLVEAADSTKSYQAGVKAGMHITEEMLATYGALPITALGVVGTVAGAVSLLGTNKKKSDVVKDETIREIKQMAEKTYENAEEGQKVKDAIEIVKKQQRFIAIANGILFAGFGAKGIVFRIDSESNEEKISENDTLLRIENHSINKCLIRYAYFTEEQANNTFILYSALKRSIGELVLLNPAPEKKVMFVTNSPAAFDYLDLFKDKLSYRGDLSIVLVDDDNALLIKEEYISHYSYDDCSTEIYVIEK